MARRIISKPAQKSTMKTDFSWAKKPSSNELRSLVEKKAYELFERRGYQHGSDLNDWFEAERIVIRQIR